jgi:hypothetical protein
MGSMGLHNILGGPVQYARLHLPPLEILIFNDVLAEDDSLSASEYKLAAAQALYHSSCSIISM